MQGLWQAVSISRHVIHSCWFQVKTCLRIYCVHSSCTNLAGRCCCRHDQRVSTFCRKIEISGFMLAADELDRILRLFMFGLGLIFQWELMILWQATYKNLFGPGGIMCDNAEDCQSFGTNPISMNRKQILVRVLCTWWVLQSGEIDTPARTEGMWWPHLLLLIAMLKYRLG